MTAAVDRLGGVIAAQYSSRGIKAPKIPSMPRPETAFERLMRKKYEGEKKRVHESIVSAVLPNRTE